MTLTAAQPFTTQDQLLGVAYISIILVWCFLTMFPLGGWLLVKRDFEAPLVRPDEESCIRGSATRLLSLIKSMSLRRRINPLALVHRVPPKGEIPAAGSNAQATSDKTAPTVHQSEVLTFGMESEIQYSQVQHPDPPATIFEGEESPDLTLRVIPEPSTNRSIVPWYRAVGKKFTKILLNFLSPPAVSCFLSLIIALVPQLKALFVPNVPDVKMPNAPDGLPPLDWILDIADFGGYLNVLCQSDDRGCFSTDWTRYLGCFVVDFKYSMWITAMVQVYLAMTKDRGSIVLMTLLKLAVLPVIGVLWTHLLTSYSPLVHPDQKMLRFVMILLSGGTYLLSVVSEM
jgi:auxin efflux carrier family protein